MNRFLLGSICAGLALLAASCATAPDVAPNTPAVSRFAVVGVGEVPENLVGHAREWAEYNLAIRVDALAAQRGAGRHLDEIAAQALKAAAGYPHVVAITMAPAGINNHGMRTADGRASVVNLRPLVEDKPAEETLRRRIERQTLRAMALMLDMPTCPNPQCVLVHYNNLSELDRCGRNCCPPCVQSLQRAAAREKLELNPDSPFFIGN